jgi:hypothetical protein
VHKDDLLDKPPVLELNKKGKPIKKRPMEK